MRQSDYWSELTEYRRDAWKFRNYAPAWNDGDKYNAGTMEWRRSFYLNSGDIKTGISLKGMEKWTMPRGEMRSDEFFGIIYIALL